MLFSPRPTSLDHFPRSDMVITLWRSRADRREEYSTPNTLACSTGLTTWLPRACTTQHFRHIHPYFSSTRYAPSPVHLSLFLPLPPHIKFHSDSSCLTNLIRSSSEHFPVQSRTGSDVKTRLPKTASQLGLTSHNHLSQKINFRPFSVTGWSIPTCAHLSSLFFLDFRFPCSCSILGISLVCFTYQSMYA